MRTVIKGVLQRVLYYSGYSRGNSDDTHGLLKGHLGGFQGALKEYYKGTKGYSMGTKGTQGAPPAGVTWSPVTSNAPWAAREGYTIVIDAAGTMFLIGGYGCATGWCNDVWSSVDKGEDRTQGGLQRVLMGKQRVPVP